MRTARVEGGLDRAYAPGGRAVDAEAPARSVDAAQLVAQEGAETEPHGAKRQAFGHADHGRSDEREFHVEPERQKRRLAANKTEDADLFQTYRIGLPAP